MYGKVSASKDSILKYINEYDIFKYYIDNFNYLGKLFRSELRQDKNPTCSIAKLKGTLKYTDFGTEIRGVDCFNYVMMKFNINYFEALDKIVMDFNLPLLRCTVNSNLSYSDKAPVLHNFNLDEIPDATTSILKVKIRDFHLGDKKYWWDKYQITIKELRAYNIHPVEYYIHNGQYINNKALTYGYFFGIDEGVELWKMYCPNNFRFDIKWRTNCNSDVIQGYNQLPDTGDLLIITKSLKDVVILSKIGIPAISPQAEFHVINDVILEELKSRFNQIIILYDNDSQGIKAANIASELYQLPNVYLPIELGKKDPSDFVEYYGYGDLQKTIYYLCGKL